MSLFFILHGWILSGQNLYTDMILYIWTFLFHKLSGNYTQKPQTKKHSLKRGNQRKDVEYHKNPCNTQKHNGKEPTEAQSDQKTNYKITIENLCTSIIALNVNGLIHQKKRHRVADWIKKQNTTICCLQET